MFLDEVNESDSFNGIDFIRTWTDVHLESSVTRLVNVLKDNLNQRFPEIELYAAFSALVPQDFPANRTELNVYGRGEIKKLADKFDGLLDSTEIITEWHECKSEIYDNLGH